MIDPRAIVDPGARLADDVRVGAFSIIGPGVEIDSGTEVGSHVIIKGPTRIGRDNRIFQFASVGEAPQDKKYAGEATRLEIGDRNVIREYVTVNRGTVQDRGVTSIGDDNWLMAYVHVAHDCRVGNQTIFANGASLAGHVNIDDYAILGGFTLVHQFCSLGAHCFTGMGSAVGKDVPPYVMVNGAPAQPRSINVEGLKRRGFSPEAIQAIRRAYKLLYRSGLTFEEAQRQIAALADQQHELARFRDFLAASQRGVVR